MIIIVLGYTMMLVLSTYGSSLYFYHQHPYVTLLHLLKTWGSQPPCLFPVHPHLAGPPVFFSTSSLSCFFTNSFFSVSQFLCAYCNWQTYQIMYGICEEYSLFDLHTKTDDGLTIPITTYQLFIILLEQYWEIMCLAIFTGTPHLFLLSPFPPPIVIRFLIVLSLILVRCHFSS